MKYVLFSENKNLYFYGKNSWTYNIMSANKYSHLNPMRFFLKFYLSSYYGDKIVFKKIIGLNANFDAKNLFGMK